MKLINKYIISILLLTMTLPMVAAPVKFTTNLSVGSRFNLALNSGVSVSVEWDNGESEKLISDGSLQTIEVKGTTAQINVDQDILSLYLGNNGMTALTFDITANSIQQLYCPGNELTTLDLSACQNLVELNCQDNKLENIVISSTLLEICDLINNQLKEITIPNDGEYLSTLALSGNQITEIPSLGNMKSLKTLFMANNKIAEVSLRKNKQMRNVVAYNNAMNNIQTSGLKNLQQIWVSNNNLTKLDLDAASQLVSVKADHNSLSQIKWTKDCNTTFKFIDVAGNNLFFNSLPTIYDKEKKAYTVDAHILPQNPYFLANSVIQTRSYNQWKNEFTSNGWNAPTALETHFYSNGDLIPVEDFTLNEGVLTFNKPHTQVTLSATSAEYPELTLTTSPFDVKEMSFGNLTFNYIYNGKVIATETKEYELGTSVEELPQKHENDFCIYEFDKKVVDSPNDTVNVKVIWNGPFEFSESFETATWYYLTINAQNKHVGYLHDRDLQPIELTTKAGDSDYYWAFLGDPFHIQVINLFQGKDKYLNATPEFPLMQSEPCSWTIFAANTTKGKFLLHDDERGYTSYVNKNIKYNHNAKQGAHFIVQKAPSIETDFTKRVIGEISPFFDEKHIGHYFEISQEAFQTYKDKVKAAESKCDVETFNQLKEVITNNIIYPKDGYYRLKNISTNGYLYAKNRNELCGNGDGNSVETVVELRSVLPPGTYYKEEHPFLLIQNKWCSNTNIKNTPTLLDSKANFVQYHPIAPGKFAFAIAFYNARPGWEQHLAVSFYTVDNEGIIRGSETTPTAESVESIWTIEDATVAKLPMETIGDNNYQTLCVPYPVTVENGVGHTVSLENDKGVLHKISGTVPTKTPMLISSFEKEVVINIVNEETAPLDLPNILTGRLLSGAMQSSELYLGQKDNLPGFFPGSTGTMEANRAFVPAASALAEGFYLDLISTGIDEIRWNEDSVIYDLQGRKVAQPQKGIYIINNRKVYVK